MYAVLPVVDEELCVERAMRRTPPEVRRPKLDRLERRRLENELIGRFVKGGRRLESPAKNFRSIEEECASVDVGGGGGVKGGRERTCVCERVVSDL